MMDLIAAMLPPDVGAGLFVIMLSASFIASFITISFGIGGGAVLLAVLATFLPPAVLLPVHGSVQVGSGLGRAVTLFRHISWKDLPGFTIGSLVGASLGGLLFVNIPPALIQIGIGAFIIWSVFSSPPAWMRRWSVLTGGISSFLTMFFGATGPFVATFTKALGLDRHGYVATHAALMTVQHLLKTFVFGFLGFAFGPWIGAIVLMIGAGLAGTLLGRLVLNRIAENYFRHALNILLLLIALRLMWTGAMALQG